MADDTQTEDEPSIEEILDSIRQIISEEDEDETPVVEEEAPPVDEPEPVQDDEPLDQGAIDDIDFDAPADDSEPLDQGAIDDIDFDTPTETEEDVLELTDLVDSSEDEPVETFDIDMIEEEPEVVEEPAPPPPVAPESSLLTENAENAAVSAMSELVRKTAVESNGITLEDIVRTELKPLLRDWLDKHLPTVIERLVQEELERVSKRVLEE